MSWYSIFKRLYPQVDHILPGLYYYFIKEWFRAFPREQFMIINFKDYKNNKTKTLNRIFKFLELSKYHLKTTNKWIICFHESKTLWKEKVGNFFWKRGSCVSVYYYTSHRDYSNKAFIKMYRMRKRKTFWEYLSSSQCRVIYQPVYSNMTLTKIEIHVDIL